MQSEPGLHAQLQRVEALKERVKGLDTPQAHDLLTLADTLVKRSVRRAKIPCSSIPRGRVQCYQHQRYEGDRLISAL